MQTSWILASASPRRQELLQLLQIPFECIPADVNEDFPPQLSPEQVVEELALRKAITIASQYPNRFVIGSDTIVVFEGEILGKPDERDMARRMLLKLSGQAHEVYTGVAIAYGQKQHVFVERTKVQFWDLTEEEIERYLDTNEPFDKAGSYGIQGYGSLLVKEIEGDYFNVVGLPVSKLAQELKGLRERWS